MPETQTELLANRYQVLGELGRGGLGKVLRVLDTLTHQELALKKIYYGDESDADSKATLADSLRHSTRGHISAVTHMDNRDLCLKQEFRSMIKLRHPNTVAVYDYGMLSKTVDYITMEIVKGQELREVLKQRKLNFAEIGRIMAQLGEVLSFIHSRLMVHRDLKPENLMVLPSGDIKLMDFGFMEQVGQPSEGQITGTIAYMPPEVIQGGVIDGRSDLYSFGCMAYEMITGKVPFEAPKIMDVLKMHVGQAPEAPHVLRPDVPPALERLTLKLLEKEAAKRPASAAEVLEELAKITGETYKAASLEHKKSYLHSSELIGRDQEMRLLQESFRKVAKGEGHSLFLAAPAGVGKSRLIQEFKLQVQLAEVPFLVGRCAEQGQASYEPLAEPFRTLCFWTKPEDMEKFGPVLVKILPELSSKGIKPLPALDPVGEKVRLLEQVTEWLKSVARQTPFVLCMEDLHWADMASLELVNACIRELRAFPVFVLGTFRDDEVEPTSVLYQTEEEKLTTIKRLASLSPEHVRRLVQGMLGPSQLTPEFMQQVYDATAGNAFFVSEVMRSLIEENVLRLEQGRWYVPGDLGTLNLAGSIEETIARRLRFLSPQALDLLQRASVAGNLLDLETLKILAELETEVLFQCLDEAVERQFLKKQGADYLFSHDRVRETLYAQLDVPRRRELHGKVGGILEKRQGARVTPSELAYHFDQARMPQKAIPYLIRAGKEAVAKNASVEATQHLKKANELLEENDYPDKNLVRLETLELLGSVSLWVDPRACITALEKTVQLLYDFGNIRGFVKTIKTIFALVNKLPKFLRDPIKTFLSKPQPPKKKLKGDFPTLLTKLITAQAFLAAAYPWASEYPKALTVTQKSFDILPDPEGPFFGAVVLGEASALIDSGNHDVLREHITKAIRIFEASEKQLVTEQLWYFYAYSLAVYEQTYAWIGRSSENKAFLERAEAIAKKHNFVEILCYVGILRVERAAATGRSAECLAAAHTTLDWSKKMGRPLVNEMYTYPRLSKLYLESGHLEEAYQYATKMMRLSEHATYDMMYIAGKVALGLVLKEMRETDEAQKHLLDGLERARKVVVSETPPALCALASLRMEQGRIPEARGLLQEVEEILTTKFKAKQSLYEIEGARLLGQVHFLEKKYEKAIKYLKYSAELAHLEDNPLQEGLALVHWSRVSKALGMTTDSTAKLQAARAAFEKIQNTYQIKKLEEEAL